MCVCVCVCVCVCGGGRGGGRGGRGEEISSDSQGKKCTLCATSCTSFDSSSKGQNSQPPPDTAGSSRALIEDSRSDDNDNRRGRSSPCFSLKDHLFSPPATTREHFYCRSKVRTGARRQGAGRAGSGVRGRR